MVDCLLSAVVRTLRPRRTYDNGNGPPPNTARARHSVSLVQPLAYRKALEDGLSEVDDIRSQLEKLQLLVSQKCVNRNGEVDPRK
uniref:Uncharacterized protein n=1 Tax=Haemonchus contortus TaxID=6289 RepID=A0A7I4YNF3_HAECO